jgi:hypothetical protein
MSHIKNSNIGNTIIIVITLSIVSYFTVVNYQASKQEQATIPTTQTNYKDIAYMINGTRVQLSNGTSVTEAAPGSASKITTTYFGNELIKDLNNDGKDDVVFLLTQSTGGSGTFFYVVAALKNETGYSGSQALLLGDRIAPQTTVSGPNRSIIVTYADRKANESFDVAPSVGKSIRLILDPTTMQFGEWVQNFEGESNR